MGLQAAEQEAQWGEQECLGEQWGGSRVRFVPGRAGALRCPMESQELINYVHVGFKWEMGVKNTEIGGP